MSIALTRSSPEVGMITSPCVMRHLEGTSRGNGPVTHRDDDKVYQPLHKCGCYMHDVHLVPSPALGQLRSLGLLPSTSCGHIQQEQELKVTIAYMPWPACRLLCSMNIITTSPQRALARLQQTSRGRRSAFAKTASTSSACFMPCAYSTSGRTGT